MYRPFASSVPDSRPFLDVESTIRGLSQDYSTAFNTGNYDQVANLFSSDGLFMTPQREPAHGPKAIERLLRQYGESGYQDLRLETVRVDYSTDMAVEMGHYTIVIRQENGVTVADQGTFMHAWRRFGAWLMIGACWSSSLPLIQQQLSA
jgi:uncharacterized protein (TIGR02246 family)